MTVNDLLPLFRKTFLNPYLTGTLVAFKYIPKDKVAEIIARLPQFLAPVIEELTKECAKTEILLKVLLAWGILRSVNKYLNSAGLNNYTSDNTYNWSKEIVVITGGSNGIGLAIAKKFASTRNPKVIILDVEDPAEPLPPNTFHYSCDITDTDAVRQVAEQIQKEHGHPTVLINNAGVGVGKSILDVPEHAVRKTYNVNVLAHYWTLKAFLPNMIENDHGHIVTVASVASFLAPFRMSHYSGSKAAALAFHETLAAELRVLYGAPKVRLTSVHPNWVRTRLINGLQNMDNPFYRELQPDEVAQSVVNQIYSTRGAQLILPDIVYPISYIRAWPNWIQEYIRSQGRKLKYNAPKRSTASF